MERTRYVAFLLPQGSGFLNIAGVTSQCQIFYGKKNGVRFFFLEFTGKSNIHRNLEGEIHGREKVLLFGFKQNPVCCL